MSCSGSVAIGSRALLALFGLAMRRIWRLRLIWKGWKRLISGSEGQWRRWGRFGRRAWVALWIVAGGGEGETAGGA